MLCSTCAARPSRRGLYFRQRECEFTLSVDYFQHVHFRVQGAVGLGILAVLSGGADTRRRHVYRGEAVTVVCGVDGYLGLYVVEAIGEEGQRGERVTQSVGIEENRL